MHEPDDKHLMLRFQRDGDEAAFGELFRRHRDPFYRFLLRLSGDAAVAQDVSQHSWLQLLEASRRGAYRADASASFQTWLFTLGRNRYVDAHQRSHAAARTDSLEDHAGVVDALAGDAADEPDRILQACQDRERLEQAMARLSREQRELLAFWLQGYDLKDIARMTDTSWHTLVDRKKAALARLARELEP
jgi:RNA polymerase sigma factor (sigma-70 family)